MGIRTDVVKNDFQINDMFGIHAGGTSVIAHNAYTYYEAATSTWKWKRMVDGVGNDKRPAALGLWNGTLSVQVAGEGLAESPITWNTALSIANDGKVAISSLAATGDPRPVYVNSSGELIDGSTGTLTSWGLNGNTGTTSSNFIGTTTGSNQPLIFKSNGVQRMKIFGGTSTDNNTYIQIGTTYFNPSSTGQELPTGLTCRVSVDGQIVAKEYLCKAATWSDFVFHENYNLRSLDDVETYIKENGHLPEIPSETEVQDQGINLAEIQAKLLQKVEELTLYMIDLKRQNDILSHEVQILKQNQKK